MNKEFLLDAVSNTGESSGKSGESKNIKDHFLATMPIVMKLVNQSKLEIDGKIPDALTSIAKWLVPATPTNGENS